MKAPFAISPETGHISFPDLPLELYPGMPEAEFIKATSSLNRDNLGANSEWQRYLIRAAISGERRLGIFVIFLNDRLNKTSFTYADKGEAWDNWSEEREHARLNEFEQELTAQLGSKQSFPWGTVSTGYDSKSGETNIRLSFSNGV